LHIGKGINIGKSQSGKINSRIQDQIDLLEWSLNYCLQNKINTIVITGDVYQDPRPHPGVISIVMCWLIKCQSHSVSVHIIRGNHDVMRSGTYSVSALDLVSDVNLHAKVYKDFSVLELENDTSIVFIPFRDKRMYEVDSSEEAIEKLNNEIDSLSPKGKVKIAIGHLALEGSLEVGDEIADALNEIYVPKDVFKTFDFVWMGHVHHPQVVQESPYIAHIGSLDRSDFSRTETENDKIAVVFDTATCSFKNIVLPTRTLKHIQIVVPNSKDSTEFVINHLCLIDSREKLINSMLRVEIILNGLEIDNIQRDKVEGYLYNNIGVFHVVAITESRKANQESISSEESFDNSLDISKTIHKWADLKGEFESEEEKLKFKALAFECLEDYKSKYNEQAT
jgi:exonuclease SbcD